MLNSRFINAGHKELNNFETLCDIIRENSIAKLVLSFTAFRAYGANLDNVVADKTNTSYDLTIPPPNIINSAMHEWKISVAEIAWTSRPSYYNWVKEVKEHLDEYIWVYNLLEDDWSKETFHRILLCRFMMDFSYLDKTYMPVEYFDDEVMPHRKGMVLADCGAYDGDSAMILINNFGDDYRKMFVYEPTPATFQRLKNTLSQYHDIEFRNAGVGKEKGILKLSAGGNGAANFIDYDDIGFGNTAVPIVTLDEDINEPVSFIKMDIEGSETNALKGAKSHIINDKPQLAICVYHLMEDLRTIPQLIYSFNENQKFHLRNHQEGAAGELVFYADPQESK